MASNILKGADTGKMPIQDAQRVALVFNLIRAKTLGLDIPPDILLAADEVFRK
jgi:putative ABC transport system substrate-binding protein